MSISMRKEVAQAQLQQRIAAANSPRTAPRDLPSHTSGQSTKFSPEFTGMSPASRARALHTNADGSISKDELSHLSVDTEEEVEADGHVAGSFDVGEHDRVDPALRVALPERPLTPSILMTPEKKAARRLHGKKASIIFDEDNLEQNKVDLDILRLTGGTSNGSNGQVPSFAQSLYSSGGSVANAPDSPSARRTSGPLHYPHSGSREIPDNDGEKDDSREDDANSGACGRDCKVCIIA